MEKFYSPMAKNLFWGMFAGIVEKSCQIHFVSALGISGKTDGFDERFLVAFGVEKGAMDAAEVDKIERGATEDEKGLKIVFFGNPCKIDDPAATGIHCELADPAEIAVNGGAVREHFGAVGNFANAAEAFLFAFFLDR